MDLGLLPLGRHKFPELLCASGPYDFHARTSSLLSQGAFSACGGGIAPVAQERGESEILCTPKKAQVIYVQLWFQ